MALGLRGYCVCKWACPPRIRHISETRIAKELKFLILQGYTHLFREDIQVNVVYCISIKKKKGPAYSLYIDTEAETIPAG